MRLYKFDRLIKKYSVTCILTAEASSGRYEGGEWLPDPSPPGCEITGALIPMLDRKIYQSGGTYTEQDRELLTSIEIPLEPVHYIAYQGAKYKVESKTDYSDYAGFYAYNLKRVGAFDR